MIMMVFPEDKLDQDVMDTLEWFWAEEYKETVEKLIKKRGGK